MSLREETPLWSGGTAGDTSVWLARRVNRLCLGWVLSFIFPGILSLDQIRFLLVADPQTVPVHSQCPL